MDVKMKATLIGALFLIVSNNKSLPENHKVVTTSYNLMERLFNFVEGVQTHP